ncbi:MAG: hypothetical protein KDB61_10915, partial [Planctomycetes bacterium]|nr:hypothetical protein [Planctomycetota bacterium]
TCSGGMNNITTQFHPTVINTMRAGADSSCLQPYSGTSCTADAMEPNNACGSGNPIGAGVYANLTACGTDSDYYRISVAPNETITVDLAFTHANGDIDLNLWDNFCVTNLDSSTSTSNSESVTWTNNSGSTATVAAEAFLYGGGTGPGSDYTMTVTLVTIDPCASIADDVLEDNDSCAAALPVVDGAWTGLFVAKTDADFYEMCVAGGATLDINTYFSHAAGDVDIFLYDPGVCGSGTFINLAQGYSATDDEVISWTNPDSFNRTVVLEVRMYPSSASNCNNYDLVVAGAGANCGVPGSIGSIYCTPANFNSTLVPAVINATGSQLASDNNVTLSVTQLPPNQFGYFLNSMDQAYLANPGGSMGILCVGGPSGFGRHINTLQLSGPTGFMIAFLDLNHIPTSSGVDHVVVAGETFNFQCWYRDYFVTNTSNFSDAVSITFQ